MHFFMNEVFAAPASGLPSLPTALLSQDSCAKAEPDRKGGDDGSQENPFHGGFPPLSQNGAWIGPWNPAAIKFATPDAVNKVTGGR